MNEYWGIKPEKIFFKIEEIYIVSFWSNNETTKYAITTKESNFFVIDLSLTKYKNKSESIKSIKIFPKSKRRDAPRILIDIEIIISENPIIIAIIPSLKKYYFKLEVWLKPSISKKIIIGKVILPIMLKI